MPSSISSSNRLTAADRPGVAQPVPERDVPDLPWLPMLLAALLLAIALCGAWEWQWRSFGAVPGIRDDDALWARQRRRIDAGQGNATVLVGASRTFFDIQLPVWEKLSGRRPVQLALDGTSPVFALEDLAKDPLFTGRLVIGIAPDIFFSGFEHHPGLVRYTTKESPSERVGKYLSMHLLEPWAAFYDADFALFEVLKRQPWPVRAGMKMRSSVRKLSVTEADRNNYMWSKLETDRDYRELARHIWAERFHKPPPTPKEAADDQRTLDEQITRTVAALKLLRARGVAVLFVRDPSSGDYLAYEDHDYPRRSTWDVLIKKTAAPGIHFQDYPQLQGYDIPEWSHLTRSSAERYTEALYRIIERDFALPGGARW
jgi:hypothetical protein